MDAVKANGEERKKIAAGMAYNGMNRSSRARRDACLGNSTDAGTSRRFEFKDAVWLQEVNR